MSKKLITPLLVILFCVVLIQSALAHDLPYSYWTGEYIQPNDPDVQRIVSQVCTYPLEENVYENVKALYYWVAYNVRYMSDIDRWGEKDYWQLPGTTIQLGTGDCEDQAILLTSLIRAAGVPRERVHLVYGYVYVLGTFVGAHCWVEVKLGTGSLEEASDALAPYVGDELFIYTNETVANAILTEEKLEEIKTLGWGARDGWLPLDTAFEILEWPIEIPIPFEVWMWFGYYTYWLALGSVEPMAFYVDPPQPVTLTVNPSSIDVGATVTISVSVSDSDWHDLEIVVIKPSGSSNSKNIRLKGGTSQSFTYGVDWGTATDEIGTYIIRVYEYWYDPIIGSIYPPPQLRVDVVGETTFSVYLIQVIPQPTILINTLLMLGALAIFYLKKHTF